MASLLDKAVAKATFDPELEKQIADNKQQARDARATLQKAISEATAAMRSAVQERKVTPVGATYLESLFTETTKWVDSHSTASANDVLDKNTEFTTQLAQLYTDDANRLYYTNVLMFWDALLGQWSTQNKVSEDVARKAQSVVTKEKSWATKHPDESIQIYQDRLTTLYDAILAIVNDPDLKKEIDSGLDTIKKADTSKEVEALQANAQQAIRDKEEVARQNFSISRTFSKAAKGMGVGLLVALFLAFGFIGAALASNFAITRSIPIRVLCWLYGFVFSLPVLVFFLVRYYKGVPPVFYAYLIPLYTLSPEASLQNPSFLQRLISYTPLPPSA